MHQSSLENMLAFRETYLKDRKNEALRIFDLGSLDINGSYRQYFDVPKWRYQGMDMTPGKNVDIVLRNPYRWREIRSGSADVFISGQAFEHIEYFWLAMLEIARVLKSGGLCCIIAPSGGFEHRYPVDCWRFYPDGFAALARFARLEVLEVNAGWEPDPRHTDDSNKWQDCVLICQKPRVSKLASWRNRIRGSVLHRMLAAGQW